MIDPTAKFGIPGGNAKISAAYLDKPPSTQGDPAEVAQRFEAIFVQQFVTSMRTSTDSLGDGMFGKESGNDTYAAWFDQFMSEHIVRNGGLGLARVIEKDIARHHGVALGSGSGRMAVTA